KGWRGNKLTHWLTPDQAFAIFRAAEEIAAPPETRAKFRTLLVVLCYTGMRLSEGLRIQRQDIDRAASTVLLPRTKNGEPRLVYLPGRHECAGDLPWRNRGRRATVLVPRRRPALRPARDDDEDRQNRVTPARRVPC